MIKPLLDRVVVKKLPNESTGGIVLPDNVEDKVSRGEVVAIGPGRRGDNNAVIPMSVKVGDKVLFEKHLGQKVKTGNLDVVVLYESELIGKL